MGSLVKRKTPLTWRMFRNFNPQGAQLELVWKRVCACAGVGVRARAHVQTLVLAFVYAKIPLCFFFASRKVTTMTVNKLSS